MTTPTKRLAIKSGMLAKYITGPQGMIRCRIVSILPSETRLGFPGHIAVTVKLLETKRAYYKGEIIVVSHLDVVPCKGIRISKLGTIRIPGYDVITDDMQLC